jgi:hypothetical protein
VYEPSCGKLKAHQIGASTRIGLILRSPSPENIEEWHINKDFMWSYVLAAHLLAPPLVGLIFHPGQ